MKKIWISILVFSISLPIVGCGIFSKTNVNLSESERVLQNANTIHDIVSEATFVAIKKVYKDNKAKQIIKAAKLRNTIDSHILPLLNDSSENITQDIQEEFFSSIPEEYHGLMATAYETFYQHYEFPVTSEFLPDPYLTYLRSFFNGVRSGANKVLVLSERKDI